jgi:formylmethanofuran dehydrogenase subunit E
MPDITTVRYGTRFALVLATRACGAIDSGGVRMTATATETLTPIQQRPFADLLDEAVAFHGHLCPGQVLGVRMTLAGCRELGVDQPRLAGKRLVVFVEIDRCATDAIQALTGVSLGKRTLKHVDHGKMAATFVDAVTGHAVRVVARDDARQLARFVAPWESDPRRAQTAAYRTIPENKLLRLERVTVDPRWLQRRRVRVSCERCGEDVNYESEIQTGDRVVCRACAGESYYTVAAPAPVSL